MTCDITHSYRNQTVPIRRQARRIRFVLALIPEHKCLAELVAIGVSWVISVQPGAHIASIAQGAVVPGIPVAEKTIGVCGETQPTDPRR